MNNDVWTDRAALLEWIRARWKPGCWLGDVSREPVSQLSADDFFNMAMAWEGWFACERSRGHRVMNKRNKSIASNRFEHSPTCVDRVAKALFDFEVNDGACYETGDWEEDESIRESFRAEACAALQALDACRCTDGEPQP